MKATQKPLLRHGETLGAARLLSAPPARILFILLAAGGFLSLAAEGWADHPSAGFSEDGDGPIQTISATPLPKGKWGASVSVEYHKFDAPSDEELLSYARQGRSVESTDSLISTSLGLSYGLTDDLTLMGRIPYVKRNDLREGHQHEDGDVELDRHGDSRGMGDLTLLGKWRLLKDPVEVAPLLGVKIPTGDTDEKDKSGRRLETDHQPGTGSWDGLFGLALTKQAGRWTWSGSFLYHLVTEGAQETDIGDHLALGGGFSYRWIGASSSQECHDACHPPGHSESAESPDPAARPLAVDLVLEGIWEHQQPVVTRDVKNPESGGSQLWVAPGIRFGKGRWSWSTSVGVPVSQDMNGAGHKSEVKVLSVLSTSF